jgi:hypothetical protein
MATSRLVTEDLTLQLDDLLFEICEELQLSPTRYNEATDRYTAMCSVLESTSSPFRLMRPNIYPQGSMALGTTVKPIEGPHDLDFVLQLSLDHLQVNPMTLIATLHQYLQGHGTYRNMVELKNRCVRVVYANEFFMDILPACINTAGGGGCIKVPDRDSLGWKDSNPLGFISWFGSKNVVVRSFGDVIAKAQPLPSQEAVADKTPLQLAVQLWKRWRDIYYADRCEVAPISIVLTTLAAEAYSPTESVSDALLNILRRVVFLVENAARSGEVLSICNPSNRAEDLSERWKNNREAYDAFVDGAHVFLRDFERVKRGEGGYKLLESLFGETVNVAIRKQAVRFQGARTAGKVGVTSSGLLSTVHAQSRPMVPNTYHGEDEK